MRRRSIYEIAGMTVDALQVRLSEALAALQDLRTGAKGESYSYTQGDGARSVVYTRASADQLETFCVNLAAQIERMQGGAGRRPIRFRFR